MEFIMSNFEALAIALAAVILGVYAIMTRQWFFLHRAALSLMLSAEKLMATESGKRKMEEVYKAVWQRIPKWMKRFLSENTLRIELQRWYDLAKGMLSNEEQENGD